jgi:ribosome hibernation promoting factor
MRLVLTGRHVDISPGLRRLVDRKLARLERLLGGSLVSAQVTLTLEKQRHVADVTAHARGDHVLNGRVAGPSWSAALGASVEKIQRQAATMKGKWEARKRRTVAPRRPTPEPAAGPAGRRARPPRRVVRVSRAQIKPMSIESAAVELEASGEAFLLFRNAETDGLSVLVRSGADRFGLIEPER